VGPASVMVGTIVQGNRLATAQGRDIGIIDMESDSNKTVRKYSHIIISNKIDILVTISKI